MLDGDRVAKTKRTRNLCDPARQQAPPRTERPRRARVHGDTPFARLLRQPRLASRGMRPGEKARTSYLASRERLQARATPTDNERFDARLRSNSRRSQLGDHAACAPARARLPRQMADLFHVLDDF